MQLAEFLDRLKHGLPVTFKETMRVIDNAYLHRPTAFLNGPVTNYADQNQGACKVFAFGKLHQLSEDEILACFGEHYRDVLADPLGSSHANIRAFMLSGWQDIKLDAGALTPKN